MCFLNIFYASIMSFVVLTIVLLVRNSFLQPVSYRNIFVVLRAKNSIGELENNLKFLKSLRNCKRFNAEIIIDISDASDECIAAAKLLENREDRITISGHNFNNF